MREGVFVRLFQEVEPGKAKSVGLCCLPGFPRSGDFVVFGGVLFCVQWSVFNPSCEEVGLFVEPSVFRGPSGCVISSDSGASGTGGCLTRGDPASCF